MWNDQDYFGVLQKIKRNEKRQAFRSSGQWALHWNHKSLQTTSASLGKQDQRNVQRSQSRSTRTLSQRKQPLCGVLLWNYWGIQQIHNQLFWTRERARSARLRVHTNNGRDDRFDGNNPWIKRCISHYLAQNLKKIVIFLVSLC